MEICTDLPISSSIYLGEELGIEEGRNFSEFSVIPRSGSFLGLDISERNSGLCLYSEGKKITGNISLDTKDSVDFFEVRLRRELKGYLREFIGDRLLDLAMIEDVYQGENPGTVRKLYALNTAIDELILDGEVRCNKFLRVNNKLWKSWLYRVDRENQFKGLEDKERIRRCLALLGIEDSGEGSQDRLDACGMLVGYFYCGCPDVGKKKKFSIGVADLCFDFQEDEDFIIQNMRSERKEDEVLIQRADIGLKRWSKRLILDYIREYPGSLIISADTVKLGYLMRDFGIQPAHFSEGYFGFWVKRSRYKKFAGEV